MMMKNLLHRSKGFWREFRTQKSALLGLAIIIFFLFIALFAPRLSMYDPQDLTAEIFVPPSKDHLLGTDTLGRDLYSRIIWGSRTALMFSVGCAGLSLLIGVVLGCVPGYFGGIIDDVFCRFIEAFMMIPSLFLQILLGSLFGTNVILMMLVIGLTTWPTNARIARAQVLSIKHRAFISATIASGASKFRIIFHHILPNAIYPIVVNSTMLMGRSIILEASLSFLGLGDPNAISWGQLIRDSQRYLTVAWWMAPPPGIAILLLVFGFNLIGDGLNYALNPRLRERQL